MKKIGLLVAAVLAFVAFKPHEESTWNSDKAHGSLKFSVTHMMVSDVDGSFKIFDASIKSKKEDFSDAVVELKADVSSINTDNEQRDGHLKSADFFDAAKFPTLNFKSVTFTKVSDKNYKIVGNLTMHGVTRSVTLQAVLKGMAENTYMKKMVAGFKVTGTIKRSDFGIGGSTPTGVASDEIELVSNIEFIKQ
jgi:polyisoprenoid-binding protein YceI